MTGLLHSHSLLRYFVLIMLVVVVVLSLVKLLGKKPYTKLDDKLGLYLFIFTHLQLLVGLILYFTSDMVQFNAGTMKNAVLRYWAVEHALLNLVAIVLITLARTTSKKMTNDTAKHRRMFVFNALALIILFVSLGMSGRGILIPGKF